jgi:hypothetical protein
MPREQEQTLTIEKKLLEAPAASEFKGDVSERKGLEGLEVLDDVTMVSIPDLMTRMPGEKLNLDMVKAVQGIMIAHCERMGDRVAILDVPPDSDTSGSEEVAHGSHRLRLELCCAVLSLDQGNGPRDRYDHIDPALRSHCWSLGTQ